MFDSTVVPSASTTRNGSRPMSPEINWVARTTAGIVTMLGGCTGCEPTYTTAAVLNPKMREKIDTTAWNNYAPCRQEGKTELF